MGQVVQQHVHTIGRTKRTDRRPALESLLFIWGIYLSATDPRSLSSLFPVEPSQFRK